MFAALLVALVASARPVTIQAQTATQHTVTWDSHSLLIDGNRLLLYSGEFHYWRLPSVEQWQDRLAKMKAAGLNGVSIYFSWQYHSSAPGQYDFTGVRDIDKLLSITDKLGMYVLARVGPYMNAEADAGGLPGWVLRQPLDPRSQTWNGKTVTGTYSPTYARLSHEWYDNVIPILARHQVTTGGSVLMVSVENEYSQLEGSQPYMQELIDTARGDGITVPIFHNDFYFRGDWKSLVNIYGQDSYPYGFECCHQWWDLHFGGIDKWADTWKQLGITTPMFVSELQGGSFDPWGGQGYNKIAATLNGDWLNVLDQSAMAQGTTMLNTYMFTGGTTWGYMSYPGVYTSYDYGAPISEAGVLRPAYYSAHRIGAFLQSYGPTLAASDMTPKVAKATIPKGAIYTRTDSTTGTIFMFLRHGDAGAAIKTSVKLRLPSGELTIPQKAGTAIALPGHSAMTLLANSPVGPLHLRYTTSSVLTNSATQAGQYLVLYGPKDSDGEISFSAVPGASVVHTTSVSVHRDANEIRLNYRHSSSLRTVAISTPSGTVRLLITDSYHAGRIWTAGGAIITGASLVEDNGGSISVSESSAGSARVFGLSPDAVATIDGATIGRPDPAFGQSPLGSLSGASKPSLPALQSWKFSAEAPEIDPAFDDSSWTPADHTSTTNPNVPSTDTLLADDYGFHYGFIWYRGHFTATGTEKTLTIRARHSYAVYVNGVPVGQGDSNTDDPPHSYAKTYKMKIPAGSLHVGADNVISVLTESLGHDEGWLAGPLAQTPQGILAAKLGGGTTITWRLQGDAGGEDPPDKVRGLMNASGLYGERNGWYQPQFDDSGWQAVNLPDSWKSQRVTSPIGWYRTHFSLDIPAGESAPIGITIPHASDKAVIWVNGWLIGRYWEQKGPQHEFYVPQGVLNEHGDNTVAIAVWNRGHAGGLTSVPTLTQYTSLQAHTLDIGAPASTTADYWHTQGNRILDSLNRPIRISAVNWFGMENKFFVPVGLDKQPLDSIVAHVAALGFNAIRLPFSNELIEKNPIITSHVKANPDLNGLHALDVLDRIVAAARAHGVRIILDDGRSSAGTQPQWNGLWYTAQYPESAWLDDWRTLATRYNGDATVIGVDIRNEPHTGPPGPWSEKTYLTQGATWGPYKGVDNPETDWRLGAERGGDAILAINPHLLIFVEGIQQYPNKSQPDGIDSYWWGGLLYPAKKYPVELEVPHQLVYSPHEYGPFKYPQTYFGPKMSYAGMVKVWEKHWGFIEKQNFGFEAPIFVGEFGTCGAGTQCVIDTKPGSQGLWFTFWMKYLKTHPEISWSFWALNGTSHKGDDTKNYILKKDWKTVRLPALIDTLREIEAPPPPGS